MIKSKASLALKLAGLTGKKFAKNSPNYLTTSSNSTDDTREQATQQDEAAYSKTVEKLRAIESKGIRLDHERLASMERGEAIEEIRRSCEDQDHDSYQRDKYSDNEGN